VTRTDLINLLIQYYGYKSYLEIGVGDANDNFNLIDIETKHGIDPSGFGYITHKMPSDDFFISNRNKYDIIFVDGLHCDDQVTRDINNSLLYLNPNGTIVVHDCNPLKEIRQRVPRAIGGWYGTVWKAWVRFRQQLPPKFEMFVVDIDTGIGIMRDNNNGMNLDVISEEDLTFDNLKRNRVKWLNLKPVDYLRDMLELI
jgi:hypothetical protein